MTKTAIYPLGTLTGALAKQVAADLEARFPVLWEMLERHPLKGGVRFDPVAVVTARALKDGIAPPSGPNIKAAGSGGYYNIAHDAIVLSDGIKEMVTEAGGWRDWHDGKQPETIAQTRRDDLYTALAIHEIGHHFQALFLNGKFELLIELVAIMVAKQGTGHWVSFYSKANPGDFFAENFSAYFYYPDDLKRICPPCYALVDLVVEYALGKRELKAA